MNLQTPVEEAGFQYKRYAPKLAKLNILKLEDLLYHIPFRYDDYRIISPINIIQPGETVTIQGTVESITNQYTRRHFVIQKGIVTDDTGTVECMWFNQPYIPKIIHAGDKISLAGKVDAKGIGHTIKVSEYEVLKEGQAPLHTGRLVPVYPSTTGLSIKWIRNRIAELIKQLGEYEDYLPDEIRTKQDLPTLIETIKKIHFPENLDEADRARLRLSFDELLLSQLAAFTRRAEWEETTKSEPIHSAPHKEQITKLLEQLPFDLTGAQGRALDDIFEDFTKTKPMNRLLQGDVGSGKTVVAAIASYVAVLNGFQVAIMAPTEILATQHFETIHKLLTPFGIKIELFTGATKKSSNDFDIAIGTHALIHKKVEFKNLGFVVIDEQQRFGVEQRALLRNKGTNPHFLTMTATPIPRTVLLTIYGDLDVSYLLEMPKGRKIIKTWLAPESKRISAYEWIRKQLATLDTNGNKNQVFIICPFIEESENMQTVKAAKVEFERLQNDVFPEFKLGLLHGKQKSKEKDEVLEKFLHQKLDILVATPVVEVGIDIPTATIIVIEAAERFGLSQLHQLRGRVGRGEKESYCILFTESDSESTLARLKSLETSHNGAELAELDLKLRGAGDIYGTQQHGNSFLKIASFANVELLEKTKKEAVAIFPKLSAYPRLQDKVKSTIIHQVTPD